jgi:CBS domain-containing protein
MKAADVMVSNVITAGANDTIEDVAATLLKNHISALPVVDDKGALVGIVSEGDLMRRPEIGTGKRHSWWLETLIGPRSSATEYIRSHSHKVADVMTRVVITAAPDAPLGEIAALLERNRIKRVPIVDKGKIVGLVSRANLVQALASVSAKIPALGSADDSELRKRVTARLKAEPWRPSMLTVTVHDGVVDLWGLVSSAEEKKAARLAVEVIPGVRSVTDNLIIQPPASGMS